MLKNYLKVTLRNLNRQRLYSLINILGLAVGIAGSLLITRLVINELQFEKMHMNRKRIYRVAGELNIHGRVERVAALMPPLAPALAENFPEIEAVVRIGNAQDILDNATVEIVDRRFLERKLFFVDSTIFKVFTFPLLQGNPETALKRPFSLVLSASSARKYFGDEDPMGKTLRLNGQHDFTITGILAEIPAQTQLACEMMASYNSLEQIAGKDFEVWGRIGIPYHYLLLQNTANAQELEAKFPGFLEQNVPPPFSKMVTLFLQPLTQIYLHSDLKMELEPSGNIGYVYLFSSLAFALLGIACINFMNLATARASSRSLEVGLRKTIGASRAQLIRQFLGESIALAFIAVGFAMLIFEIARPAFGVFLNRDLRINYLQNIWIIPALLAATVIIGILAGSYPAFVLSQFQFIPVLKGNFFSHSRSLLRKILVVLQFSVSAGLIISTLIIFRQLHFVKHADLGFVQDQVIAISLKEPAEQQKYQILKDALKPFDGVQDISGAVIYPGSPQMIKIGVQPEGSIGSESVIMQAVLADFHFVSTLGLKILSGRDLDETRPTDATEAILLNQTAVRELGWDNPIGKQISIPIVGQRSQVANFTVIGVVQDFHMRSLHEKIEPLFVQPVPMPPNTMLLRLQPEQIPTTLSAIENLWQQHFPGVNLQYTFIDDAFAQHYQSEEKLGQIVTIFSILTIFIASLGLFGLATFATGQLRKEIGIRKIFGARLSQLTILLSGDFLKWVLLANVIGLPLAVWIMQRWLQNFAYHIRISPWYFIFAITTSLLIGILTVVFQTLRTALANPCDTLRYE